MCLQTQSLTPILALLPLPPFKTRFQNPILQSEPTSHLQDACFPRFGTNPVAKIEHQAGSGRDTNEDNYNPLKRARADFRPEMFQRKLAGTVRIRI